MNEFNLFNESNDLVIVNNNNVVTTSLIVAKIFGKDHKHVIRDIEVKLNRDFARTKSDTGINQEIIDDVKKEISSYYYESTYKDANNQNRKMYLMNRDGLMNLAMSYTGILAEIIRVQFIKAFNDMEHKLNDKNKQPKLTRAAQEVTAMSSLTTALCSMFPNINRGIMTSTAINISQNNAEVLCEKDFNMIKQLVPAHSDINVGSYNATQLGKELDMKAHEVNDVLSTLGFQNKINGKWQLTDKAKEYAELYPYSKNGHSDFRILWKPSVINLIKENKHEQDFEF